MEVTEKNHLAYLFGNAIFEWKKPAKLRTQISSTSI